MLQLATRHTRITLSVGVIVLTSALVIWGWWALIASGAEGYTFATGHGQAAKIELTVSSSATYNGMPQGAMTWSLKNLVPTADRFFAFSNILPGDSGLHKIGVRVERNDAYVCLDFTNLVDSENGYSPAEIAAGDETSDIGVLSQLLQVFAWRDSNGNGMFDDGELPLFATAPVSALVAWNDRTYALADSATGGPQARNTTSQIGVMWCLGELIIESGVVTCIGEEVGNQAQTDQMTFDVSLRAVAALGKPGFTCTDREAGLVPGQCPVGYEKIIDGYRGGLSWTADSDYAGVVLAGGPPNSNNQDPDGRFKYFTSVLVGQTIAREAHDISFICTSQTPTPDVMAEVTTPFWEVVIPSISQRMPAAVQAVRNRLGV